MDGETGGMEPTEAYPEPLDSYDDPAATAAAEDWGSEPNPDVKFEVEDTSDLPPPGECFD